MDPGNRHRFGCKWWFAPQSAGSAALRSGSHRVGRFARDAPVASSPLANRRLRCFEPTVASRPPAGIHCEMLKQKGDFKFLKPDRQNAVPGN
ncbi:MAG: hypothetical protein QOJ40_1758 [Verrucomicrobiota bacterium]